MDIDPSLFKPESVERFEVDLVEKARIVIATDDKLALSNLFQLVEGYAGHLRQGMMIAGFPDDEAGVHAWDTAWKKLRILLDAETPFTQEIAAYLERNLGEVNPYKLFDSVGEPLDSTTRTFYRVFIDKIEHPAVHQTARWLFEDI